MPDPSTGAGKVQPSNADAALSALDESASKLVPSRDFSDEGNAECTLDLFPNQILFTEERGFHRYTGTHWESGSGTHGHLVKLVRKTLAKRRANWVPAKEDEEMPNTIRGQYSNVSNTINFLKSLTVCKIQDFDAAPHYLNCENGVVDLRHGTLIPHDPEFRLTHLIPTRYIPNAPRRKWLRFLRNAISSEADATPKDIVRARIEWYQRWSGYCLTTQTSAEKLLFLLGPTRSGKGTATESLMSVAGGDSPIITEVGFETLSSERRADSQNFDLATLQHVRALFASESDDSAKGGRGSAMSESLVKRLTGGNKVFCAFKGRDMFSYLPKYKITLSSNHPPNISPDDDAVWQRFEFLEFPNSHAQAPDPKLKASLKTRASREAILAWAIEGAIKFNASGLGVLPGSAAIAERLRGNIDFVGQWIADCCKNDSEGKHVNESIRTSYCRWCADNGLKPLGMRALASILDRKGYPRVRIKPHRGHSGFRIKLQKDSDS